jgi:hypothetical protein
MSIMNTKAIALAAILGLSAPAITDLASNSQASAAPQFPTFSLDCEEA